MWAKQKKTVLFRAFTAPNRASENSISADYRRLAPVMVYRRAEGLLSRKDTGLKFSIAALENSAVFQKTRIEHACRERTFQSVKATCYENYKRSTTASYLPVSYRHRDVFGDLQTSIFNPPDRILVNACIGHISIHYIPQEPFEIRPRVH